MRLCWDCKSPATQAGRCTDCATKHAARQRERNARLKASGRCLRCLRPVVRRSTRCPTCADAQALRMREDRERRAARVFQAYGSSCACCGQDEPAFLSIDHVNNDGWEHRRQIGGSGGFYRWLEANHFPPGFQVLCMNCNFAKARVGVCPHQERKVRSARG